MCFFLGSKTCDQFIESMSRHTRKHEVLAKVVFMLGRRRRRRANNKTTMGQRLVFAGMRIVQIEPFSHYSIGFTSYLLTVVNDFR